jgi:hypothetical protein
VVQLVMRLADTSPMQRDAAPVVAAEMLLRRGLSDELIRAHLAHQWRLDDHECQDALDAAHILVRREHGSDHDAESA